MDLQYYPYLPNTEAFDNLWDAASEKWGEISDDLGYVGHDDERAYFQVRGEEKQYSLSLERV